MNTLNLLDHSIGTPQPRPLNQARTPSSEAGSARWFRAADAYRGRSVVYSSLQGERSVDQEQVTNVAHAVVMQVNLVGDPGEGMKMLDEVVVPLAKAQPGFDRGIWMHNEAMIGTGVMVFDTEEHASAAMKALQPPPGGPTVINCAVFEIAREA